MNQVDLYIATWWLNEVAQPAVIIAAGAYLDNPNVEESLTKLRADPILLRWQLASLAVALIGVGVISRAVLASSHWIMTWKTADCLRVGGSSRSPP